MESLDDLHHLRHAFDSGNYVHLYPLGNPVSLFMCHVLQSREYMRETLMEQSVE